MGQKPIVSQMEKRIHFKIKWKKRHHSKSIGKKKTNSKSNGKRNHIKSKGIKTIEQVSKGAKIRNRYNQVPHLTQDTNGKVTISRLDTTNESQEVSPFLAGDMKKRNHSMSNEK